MKKFLSILIIAPALAVIMVACNSSSGMKMDASDMAEFKAWKAQQEKQAAVKTSAKRSVSYQSPKKVTESQYPAKADEKKGWSKAAKGTVIGAGSGAVIGAVINKRNRAAGAVIGGVIGGGVGYGIGRSMDKKDGRS